jgi:hypothetical protein
MKGMRNNKPEYEKQQAGSLYSVYIMLQLFLTWFWDTRFDRYIFARHVKGICNWILISFYFDRKHILSISELPLSVEYDYTVVLSYTYNEYLITKN